MTVATGEHRATTASRPLTIAAGLLKIGAAIGLPMLLLFGVAGRWDWPGAWAYMALLTSGMIAASYVFLRVQPGLAEERARWRNGKRWDRPFLLFIGIIGPFGTQFVCGLDKRFGWSSTPAPIAQVLAVIVFAVAVAITARAMAVNPFFSATVRIQTDRGHVVIARGPYAYVRHPGYSAMSAATLAGPIVLGTVWGLAPAALLVGALLVRTALEDRTLQAELDGYAEYAQRVRYRILPGIW